jgi:streptogramin lyase
VTITEFPLDNGQIPRYIHAGPDGNLWFALVGTTPGIGRVSPSGERFAVIPDTNKPQDLLTMPDGTVVWTADNTALGRRLPNGVTQTTRSVMGPAYAIALTPSGDLRWTERFATSAGSVGYVCRFQAGWGSNQACAGQNLRDTRLTGLTLGGDGRLWTAGYEANIVARMNAASDDYDLSLDMPAGSGPGRLALGSDGNLWVTMFDASAVDRISPNGLRTRFALPAGAGPNDIAAGPDGAVWFTEYKAGKIGRMTTAGVVTNEFDIPSAGSQPIGITAGPDGAMWFTESATGKIGRLQLDPSLGGGGGGGGVSDRFAPRFVRGAAFSPKRFRVAAGATPTSALVRRVTPKGSALRYSLSEPSTVTIVIAQSRSGRRVGKTCRAPSRSNRRGRRCVRYVKVGTLKRRGLQGANKVKFTGRIGRKALKPGSYRATATAKDAAGNVSKPSVATFTIAR